jgi:hypothetical protein
MLDDKDESSGFKVVDRRPFSVDGTPRDAAEETKKADRAAAQPGVGALPPEASLTP